jgi:hypothetical protein
VACGRKVASPERCPLCDPVTPERCFNIAKGALPHGGLLSDFQEEEGQTERLLRSIGARKSEGIGSGGCLPPFTSPDGIRPDNLILSFHDFESGEHGTCLRSID